MAVPNTTTFSLQDVVTEIVPTTDTLVSCIADAITGDYDTNYFTAPATSLLEFRNYGAITEEGFNLPSTSSNVDNGNEAWINVDRILNRTGPSAAASSSCFMLASASSDILRGENFGFSIPSDPVGIEVIVVKATSIAADGNVIDNIIDLHISGTVQGTGKSVATPWTSAYTTVTYGGPTDLWGTSLTATQINASTFGAQLVADNTDTGFGSNTFVNSIEIKVYF